MWLWGESKETKKESHVLADFQHDEGEAITSLQEEEEHENFSHSLRFRAEMKRESSFRRKLRYIP